MLKDPRDKPRLTHQDVLALNFIRSPGIYLFRRHYRAGLRSHIMEVLNPADAEKEKRGIMIDGVKTYPKAKPIKMLRIFRTKFKHLKEAEEEIQRVKIIQSYLAPEYMALSSEFLVDFMGHSKRELILCGLQEYVQGESINPWSDLDASHLIALLERMDLTKNEASSERTEKWLQGVREKTKGFLEKLKKMIREANYIPDLAGSGNLILTISGYIKLVDINNISRVSCDPTIPLDDRGYPVCDKSIQALSLLERTILGRSLNRDDMIYAMFLDPERMKGVRSLEQKFHEKGALVKK
jgi:hypothetical protein